MLEDFEFQKNSLFNGVAPASRSECMCVCVHVCLSVCLSIFLSMSVSACACVRGCVRVCVCVRLCACARAYTRKEGLLSAKMTNTSAKETDISAH